MTRYRHLFQRSEYQIALHNYRRARRRGDGAEAQRWMKLADMHLRVADRFDDGVHRRRVREMEIARAQSIAEQKPAPEPPIDEGLMLEKLEARMMADLQARRAQANKG